MAGEAQVLTDADFGGAPSAPAPASGALTDADFTQTSLPSVSQPPVKQATTYLSDKNTVIGHPADMSHDQVNDAIQTQIYGRPRNDLHENAPTVGDKIMRAFGETAGLVIPGTLDPATAEKAAVEGGKGLVRGTEDVGKGLAGLVKWLGASMESPGIDATGKPLPAHEDILSEGVRAIGSKFTEVGQKAINFLKQREELGFEAPDPEIFRGSFVSNPSFARLTADVAQGVPALGAAALTTIATGNPIAGAGALGLIGAGQQFEASQEEGSSLGRSAVAATASGIGNTILMALPLGDAMKGFEATGMKAVVKGAAEFGGATAVLTPFNNIVAKLGGDKARQLFDGMTESILAGAVSGGILGAFAPGRGGEIDGMVQDAHKAGVSARDIDGARAEIAKQMKENPQAMENAITVYHGTRHEFDKFDIAHVGTGEGNQTYGWGLYFAEKKDVAEYYRQTTTPSTQPVPEDVKAALDKLNHLGFSSSNEALRAIRQEEAIGSSWKHVWDVKPEFDPEIKKATDAIDSYIAKPLPKGKIYEAKIPKPADFLNWDLPIAEHSEKIRKAIESLPAEIKSKLPMGEMMDKRNTEAVWTGAELYKSIARLFMAKGKDGFREASDALNKAGIPGIKYLDQQSRGFTVKLSTEKGPYSESKFPDKAAAESYASQKETEGFKPSIVQEGSSNFVVFDHRLVNGEPANGTESPRSGENKYVKNSEFKIGMGENDKTTAKSIREEFAGQKNEQIVRGNQLADEIRRILPKEKDREGLFWFKAANGDTNQLAEALNDPALSAYHDQIKAALNLPPKAVEALQKVTRYYDEAGQVAQDIGTIGNVRENYQNRIYAPDKPQDFVKTEVKSGIKQTTRHAKARVFDTEFDAARAGKTFATTDVADALSIHNEELARVNTSRKMAEAMADSGLGGWKKEVPEGWKQVGSLEKNVPIKDKNGEPVIGEDGNQVVSRSKFVAPEGIAKGLEAIADPNFVKKIDSLRNTQKYQGLVKTLDLSFSFFHHFTMAMQSLFQGGIGGLMRLPVMESRLASPEFSEIEQDFARHTGMTAKVDSNQDIMRNLVQKNDDLFSKVANTPGVKQVLKATDRSAEFLFGKIQRFLKVSDYGSKISNWIADNPDATNNEVVAAKKGFAKEINAAYGGLNWEAMGMTKSNLSLLRLVLLAPDWTISNAQLLGAALGDTGTAGQSSRSHIATALVSGMVLTEGLNKILTGHFTDKNPANHKLEVEIAPDVYVSFFRGGIGDILKFGSMVGESGLQGVSRFAQGKLAPVPRTAIGLLTNTQYTGAAIGHKREGPVMNSYEVLKYLFQGLAPVPLGLSNAEQYVTQERNKSVGGGLAVATGLARYSRPPKRQ